MRSWLDFNFEDSVSRNRVNDYLHVLPRICADQFADQFADPDRKILRPGDIKLENKIFTSVFMGGGPPVHEVSSGEISSQH